MNQKRKKSLKKYSLNILLVFGIFLLPNIASAIDLQVPLPGLASVDNFSVYLMFMYRFLVGSIGVIAVVMIMVGGFQWLTAAGSQERISGAKTTIFSATGGLLIALGSFTILQIINPDLTKLQIGEIPRVTGKAFKFMDITDCVGLLTETDVKFTNKSSGKVMINPSGNSFKCGIMYDVAFTKTYLDGKEETIKGACYGENCLAPKSGNCIQYSQPMKTTSITGYGVSEGIKYGICESDISNICNSGFGTQYVRTLSTSCIDIDKTLSGITGNTKICKIITQSENGYICGVEDVKSCNKNEKQISCSNKACGSSGVCVPKGEGVATKNYNESKRDMYPERVKGSKICCGNTKKEEINCRLKSLGCGDNEATLSERDCELYNTLTFIDYKSKETGGDKSQCSTQSEVCCTPATLR